MFHHTILLLAHFLLTYADTIIPTVSKNLFVVNKPVSPDGFERDAVVVGLSPSSASFLGPLIAGHKSQNLNFRINVTNLLTENVLLTDTSIHWHGILQKGTATSDGASYITQCPIPAGHSFLYQFNVPEQAGTFWYHSHLALQYCDGLRGPLVIYDDHDPHLGLYDFDLADHVISLTEWFHEYSQPVLEGIVSQHQLPLADSILINGKGRWPVNPTAELAIFTVQPGKRYRFRLINMACGSNFLFSIDDHRLTIIEADGVNTQPYAVDSIRIYAAQRYSFILEANQTSSNYWIRAQPNVAVDASFNNGLNSAILRYQGASDQEPPVRDITAGVELNEADIRPSTDPAAPGTPTPGAADVHLDLALTVDTNTVQFFVNGVNFKSPSLPILLQILSGNLQAQSLAPQGSVYGLPANKVIEVTIVGHDFPVPHPFHLHGHTFSVIQSSGGSFNFDNPVRRDTTVVLPNQNATIRFVTDNPGPWMFHCHVAFHQELGLSVVFAEDIDNIASANPVTDEWRNLCPSSTTFRRSLGP